jgi:integrase/recombinase XerD
MSATTSGRARRPARPASERSAKRPLKSPLAALSGVSTFPALPPDGGAQSGGTVGLSDRHATLAEFEDYLRTVNNRDGRPYEQRTIDSYVGPGKNLDAWMTATGIDGDFTALDAATLNRYFRGYYLAHSQGGTHTLQRNLIQLFNYLEHERGFATPYRDDDLNRYAPPKGRPKTLAGSFIDELLEVTGGGRKRDFETARDHAIIRILRSEGIRRSELLGMTMHTLPADVIRNPMIRLVPLKGARESGEGRLIVLAPASARALAIYLRARRGHPLADSDWVWLGTRGRGRGRFCNTGIRKMLIRRAEQAGYEDVTPHQFRHTFSDAWLKSGGSEGDLMRLNGWKSRQMVDRYADDVADQRALEAKRRRGDMY